MKCRNGMYIVKMSLFLPSCLTSGTLASDKRDKAARLKTLLEMDKVSPWLLAASRKRFQKTIPFLVKYNRRRFRFPELFTIFAKRIRKVLL